MRTTITAVTALALGLGALTACTTDPEPAPTITVSTTPTASTSPTPSPTAQSPTPTTASPSPTPTETLDLDQSAARDVVLKLYQLQNEFSMDDSLKDLTPLTNITTGAAQQQVVAALDDYRSLGAIQTAPVQANVETISQPAVDASGAKVVQVDVCVDATDVDMVNKETGESVLSVERNPVNLFTLDVINQDKDWLVSDIATTPTMACT